MTAALSLARQGYDTHLVEAGRSIWAGKPNSLQYRTWKGEDIQAQLAELVDPGDSQDRLQVHLDTQLASVDGFVGNFKIDPKKRSTQKPTIEHGVAIVATGGQRILSPVNTFTAKTRGS